MVKQTGTGETATHSSSTRPASCADCARQGFPFPVSCGNSPKTGTVTWCSRRSRDALGSPQNECIRQDLPGAGPREFSNNWSRCFPEYTPPAGSGAIASRPTFLFIAEQCSSSTSKAPAGLIKPHCHRGVRQTTRRRRIPENPRDEPEHSKMITRWASLPFNSALENFRPRQFAAGRHFTGAVVVRLTSGGKLIDCWGRRFRHTV